MPGEAVWLFCLLCVVLPLGEGTFSVSRQYHRRHAERGPIVITLDDSEGPLDEPTDIFEAAKSRQARQTGDSNPPQPRTTLAQLNTPGELYGIVHWDGLPQTVSCLGSRQNLICRLLHLCHIRDPTRCGSSHMKLEVD